MRQKAHFLNTKKNHRTKMYPSIRIINVSSQKSEATKPPPWVARYTQQKNEIFGSITRWLFKSPKKNNNILIHQLYIFIARATKFLHVTHWMYTHTQFHEVATKEEGKEVRRAFLYSFHLIYSHNWRVRQGKNGKSFWQEWGLDGKSFVCLFAYDLFKRIIQLFFLFSLSLQTHSLIMLSFWFSHAEHKYTHPKI